MGKKKPKEAEPSSLNEDALVKTGIFETLFGEAKAEGVASSSLFSDDNPFRRKPSEPSPSVERMQEDVDSGAAQPKKRKRDKEERKGLDSDSLATVEGDGAKASALATRRSKKEKKQNRFLGSTDGLNEERGENHDLGSKSSQKLREDGNRIPVEAYGSKLEDFRNSDKKRKKKRKRDEIEKEYEAKKYGVASEDVEKKRVGEKRKKADDIADSMVSKEGFDDESKLLRTVFVGNLPLKIKKKLILKEFSKFGEVDSVRVRSMPLVDTKKTRKAAIMKKQINENASSVHAYVVFKTEQAAEASLAHNMTMVAGNHIRVDRACPPRKKLKGESTPLYDPKRTLFVGNLPFDVKDEELYQLFTSMGNLESGVEAIRVVRDPHLNVGKGIGYVLFKTKEAAKMVMKRGSLKLRDRILRLSHTRSNPTQSKRQNPSEANSPAKKLSVSPSTPKNTQKPHKQSALSYQGIRATKSGDVKRKKIRPKGSGQTKTTPKGKKQEKSKERSQKRPSVAARKAKAKALKEVGIKAGTKRKLENRTPQSFQKKKKAKL